MHVEGISLPQYKHIGIDLLCIFLMLLPIAHFSLITSDCEVIATLQS